MARVEPTLLSPDSKFSKRTPRFVDLEERAPGAPPRCELCGNAPELEHRIEADPHRPEAEERWELHWCGDCAYGALWPRPEPEEAATFYAIPDYYTHSCGGGWAPQPQTLFDRVRIHLAWRLDRGVPLNHEALRAQFDKDRPTLVEIGCGSGGDLEKFAGLGFDTLGIEPDAAARAAIAERGYDAIDGTLESLPPELEERRFDLVLLSHVLEHGIDIHRAIQGLRGLLAPGGLLVVEVPNHACRGYRNAGASWAFTDAPRHLNFFTPKSLESVFAGHGFEIVENQYYGYCRQLSNEWVEAERQIRTVLTPDDRRTSGFRAKLESWKLLAQTLICSPESKYDSVRLILRAQD